MERRGRAPRRGTWRSNPSGRSSRRARAAWRRRWRLGSRPASSGPCRPRPRVTAQRWHPYFPQGEGDRRRLLRIFSIRRSKDVINQEPYSRLRTVRRGRCLAGCWSTASATSSSRSSRGPGGRERSSSINRSPPPGTRTRTGSTYKSLEDRNPILKSLLQRPVARAGPELPWAGVRHPGGRRGEAVHGARWDHRWFTFSNVNTIFSQRTSPRAWANPAWWTSRLARSPTAPTPRRRRRTENPRATRAPSCRTATACVASSSTQTR